MSDISTPKELMSISYDTLVEKKAASKHMSTIAKDTAKMQKTEPQLLNRVKDYVYYRGRGWLDNPLELDPQEKFKDRVSPTFKKLVQIIDDVYAVGQEDMLNDYLDYIRNERGIDIQVTGKAQVVKDKDDTWSAVQAMCGYQGTICALADEINFIHTEISEELNFTAKKDFKEALGFYAKVQESKPSVDDINQDKQLQLEMCGTAFNQIFDDSIPG